MSLIRMLRGQKRLRNEIACDKKENQHAGRSKIIENMRQQRADRGKETDYLSQAKLASRMLSITDKRR